MKKAYKSFCRANTSAKAKFPDFRFQNKKFELSKKISLYEPFKNYVIQEGGSDKKSDKKSFS